MKISVLRILGLIKKTLLLHTIDFFHIFSCFHMDRFAYVSKFACMQILLTCAKVYFTMRSRGFCIRLTRP